MENTRLEPSANVPTAAKDAAKADAGGGPAAQIKAAKQISGERLVYMPHCGARQRARALARMAEA